MEPVHGRCYGSIPDETGPYTPESQHLLSKSTASIARMEEAAARHGGANVSVGTRRRQRPLSAVETRQNARKRVLLYATAAVAAVACVATGQHIMAVREESRSWLLDERSAAPSGTKTQRLDEATLRLHRQLGECRVPPPSISQSPMHTVPPHRAPHTVPPHRTLNTLTTHPYTHTRRHPTPSCSRRGGWCRLGALLRTRHHSA